MRHRTQYNIDWLNIILTCPRHETTWTGKVKTDENKSATISLPTYKTDRTPLWLDTDVSLLMSSILHNAYDSVMWCIFVNNIPECMSDNEEHLVIRKNGSVLRMCVIRWGGDTSMGRRWNTSKWSLLLFAVYCVSVARHCRMDGYW